MEGRECGSFYFGVQNSQNTGRTGCSVKRKESKLSTEEIEGERFLTQQYKVNGDFPTEKPSQRGLHAYLGGGSEIYRPRVPRAKY